MRSLCLNKCLNILTNFYRNISVDSGWESMTEKWKCAIDNRKTFDAILTDLSKAK